MSDEDVSGVRPTGRASYAARIAGAFVIIVVGVVGVLVALSLSACATTPEADPGPPPDECRVVAAGSVRIPSRDGSVDDEDLKARGLVGLRDAENIYERRRTLNGRYERYIVAVRGIGLRWNHPSCM